MIYKRVSCKESIYNLLIEFSGIFPHLTEKISDIDDYAQKLSEYAFVYEALNDKECVGILIFYANDKQSKTAYISLIGVKKDKEGNGIGKALLKYCEKISMQAGMCKLKLEVNKENIGAIKFYEKNGFAFIEKNSQNSFYMIKEL